MCPRGWVFVPLMGLFIAVATTGPSPVGTGTYSSVARLLQP
jgi:hypothetical protein